MIKWLQWHRVLHDGTVFKNLHVVAESLVNTSHGRIKLHNWRGLLRICLVYKRVELSDTNTYVLIHNSYNGYYHWLLESVPKLLYIKKNVKDFTLLLPEAYDSEFYTDTLKLLKVPSVERMVDMTSYVVPHLALPCLAEEMGHYSMTTMQTLKNEVIKACNISSYPLERLYISRQKANRRKVLNESEVETLVTTFGFRVVCFEDYDFAEQVQLCANAEALVGIHGAGLSNMVFLPSNSLVIEFRKDDKGENFFFSQLAVTLRHNYKLLNCVAQDEDLSVQDADLWVDIVALKALLVEQYS